MFGNKGEGLLQACISSKYLHLKWGGYFRGGGVISGGAVNRESMVSTPQMTLGALLQDFGIN